MIELIITNKKNKTSYKIPAYNNFESKSLHTKRDMYRLDSGEIYNVQLDDSLKEYSMYINDISPDNEIKQNVLNLQNYYGYIQIVITHKDNCTYYSNNIDVCVDKDFYKKQVSPMLNYVLSNDEYLYDKYKTYSFLGAWVKESNNDWNRKTKIYERIRRTYEQVYPIFQTKKKSNIKNEYTVDDLYKIRNIDNTTISYIITHPERLTETGKGGINYNGKFYVPSKSLQRKAEINYDVYENRIILSFLKHIIHNIEKQIREYKSKEVKSNNLNTHISVPTEMTLYFFIKYIKPKIAILERFQLSFQDLYYRYVECLQCNATEDMSSLPIPTDYIINNEHYLMIYMLMQAFYKEPDFDYESGYKMYENIFKSNKLYEYYILCKLINTLNSKSGFNVRSVPSIYCYKYEIMNGCQKTTIFYQMSIHTDIQRVSDVYLFRNTTWNIDSNKHKYNNGKKINHYRPDYIIEIKDNNSIHYLIIDAKFSNWDFINYKTICQIALKYSLCISIKETPDLRISIDKVGIVYGQPHENTDDDIPKFILQNNMQGQTLNQPLLFAYKISPQNETNHNDYFSEILSI